MNNLLWEGFNLMIIGMGAVFLFLVLLVVTTTLMSTLIARLLPPAELRPTPSGPGQPPADDAQLPVVITAAIHRHRSRRK